MIYLETLNWSTSFFLQTCGDTLILNGDQLVWNVVIIGHKSVSMMTGQINESANLNYLFKLLKVIAYEKLNNVSILYHSSQI